MVRFPLPKLLASGNSLAMIDSELRAGSLVMVKKSGRTCFVRRKLLHTPGVPVKRYDNRAPGNAYVPGLMQRLAFE